MRTVTRHLRELALCTVVALCTLVALALVALPQTAHAQSAGEKAQAQMLFDEGRKLLDEGKIAEACEAFAESQRLDPAIGTQLNLASCLEKQGKTASAWALYVEVATRARREQQATREQVARERAQALEPKLSKLKVEVKQKVEGLTVTHNGVRVAENLWAKSVPVDPGEQVIRAEAPGKETWIGKVQVGADGARASITVPPLKDAPVTKEKPKAGSADEPEPDGTVQFAVGWAVMAVGVGGGVAGAVLRVFALKRNDESFEHCDPNDPEGICTQEGADLRDEAQVLQMGSVVSWAIGGALLVTGIVLVATAPSGGKQDGEVEASRAVKWSVGAGPGDAGVAVRARW